MNMQCLHAWSGQPIGGSDQAYFEQRAEHALRMAYAATDARARLVHFDLAGRYGMAAVSASRNLFERVSKGWT